MANDPLSELKLAQDLAAKALPSWLKDGSAERPAGPPQIPMMQPRGDKLQIETPASISGGATGGGEDGLPLVESIVLVDGILKYSDVSQIVGSDVP